MKRFTGSMFFLLGFLPFIVLWPYIPMVTWVVESIALILALVLTAAVLWNANSKLTLGVVPGTALLFAVGMFVGGWIVDIQQYHSIFMAAFFVVTGALLAITVTKLNEEQFDCLEPLAWGLFVGVVVQCVFCGLQVSGIIEQYAIWTQDKPLWVPHFPNIRAATGIILQRNQLAEYAMIGLIGGAFLTAKGRLRAWLFIAMAAFASVVMAWTASRSVVGYLAILAVLCFVPRAVSESMRKFRKYALVLGALLIVAQFLPPLEKSVSGVDRLQSSNPLGYRKPLWKTSWQMFAENPLTGVGTGGYALARVRLLAQDDWSPTMAHSQYFAYSHNLITQLLAENGILLTFLVCTGLGLALLQLLRTSDEVRGRWAMIAVLAMLAHSLVEYPLWYANFLMLFFVFLSSGETRGWRLPNWSAKGLAALALAMAAACVYCLRDATRVIAFSTPPRAGITAELSEGIRAAARNPVVGGIANVLMCANLSENDQGAAAKKTLCRNAVYYRPDEIIFYKLAVFSSYLGETADAIEYVKKAHHTYLGSPMRMKKWLRPHENDPRLALLRQKLDDFERQAGAF